MSRSPNSENRLERISLIHKANSKTQADIWLVRDEEEGQAVLRDYSSEKELLPRFLCRWAIRREIKVHRLLEGVEGIPRLVRILDRDRYLIEWIDGATLSSYKKVQMPAAFMSDLESVIGEMHSHHVAHGDLRNKNIMVTREGRPMVIDFSTAWWGTSPWRKPFFYFLQSLDARRLAKTKQKYCPETLTEKEKKRLRSDPWYHRLGWVYRHWIYPKLKNRPDERTNQRESDQ